MNHKQVIKSLDVIADRFRPHLEATAQSVIAEAQAGVYRSYELYVETVDRGGPDRVTASWGYEISPEKPLVFQPCPVRKFTLQVDIFCRARWRQDQRLPCEQSLVLRVWALDENVIIRDEWDSPEVAEKVAQAGRRVMLRYHFDLTGEDQPGPRYHLQAGGTPRDDEFCWLHEGVSVPRIAHPPIDLALACEVVAANFFEPDARIVLEDPTWKGILLDSQEYLLKDYFQDCSAVLNRRQGSLLKHLWGGKWD